MLEESLLIKYGAVKHEYQTGAQIFLEGDKPYYYYQIIKGQIKLNHESEDGKEFIQSILGDGQSVCEMLLFIEESYPVNAVVLAKSEILKLPKSDFFKLLEDDPSLSVMINKYLAERLYHKIIMLQNNSVLNPVKRLLGLLQYFKRFRSEQTQYSDQIPFTRKQLAAITGLRIETVIRSVKKMEREKKLKIENRKIIF